MKTIYYVDGSSPKERYYPSAYAIFKKNKIIKQKVLEENVNVYEIEFLALLGCLEIAEENSIIYSDSRQVVHEVNNKKKPKNAGYCNYAKLLIKQKNIKVIKIKRENNLAGKYLERRLKKLKNHGIGIMKGMLGTIKQNKRKEFKQRRYGNSRKH